MNNLDLTVNTKYSIENFFIYNIKIENSYKLSKDNPRFSIFNYDLIDEFRIENILEFNCRLLYQYTNYNNIGFLLHVFKLYDGVGKMFYDDYGVIKIELILSIIDNVTNTIDCKLYNTYNSNFLCIKHIKKN